MRSQIALELTIRLPDQTDRVGVAGPGECNFKIIREALGVNIAARDQALRISGQSQAVGHAAQVIDRLSQAATRNQPLSRQQLLDAILAAERRGGPAGVAQTNGGPSTGKGLGASRLQRGIARPTAPPDPIDVYVNRREIQPATEGQKHYLEAIHAHDLTLCCGPAGTGKTYLAVAAAVTMLKHGQVRKLVLVRPAVEAGEKLGFLPGDLLEKVNPYLRPLLDALHDMMDFEQIQKFMACDLIEIIPLAFMRGRTLNEALIILDEAQNTTKSQMMMFLTRLGHGSKMIVTGDTTQIDLEEPRESGLLDAVRRLRRVPGVSMVTLGRADIVRHSLVQRIVEAYGEASGGAATGLEEGLAEGVDSY